MNRQNVDLGTGPVGRLLFSFLALPTITSQIVNMLLYNPGGPGVHRPYAAGGDGGQAGIDRRRVCLPIIMVISAFAALMAMGGAPRASIEEGRGNLAESERIMGNSMTMLVAASVVLTVVFYSLPSRCSGCLCQ